MLPFFILPCSSLLIASPENRTLNENSTELPGVAKISLQKGVFVIETPGGGGGYGSKK